MPKSKNTTENHAALEKLAATLEGLPASRRAALERDLVALDRRATYGGAKRGRPPKLGESLT